VVSNAAEVAHRLTSLGFLVCGASRRAPVVFHDARPFAELHFAGVPVFSWGHCASTSVIRVPIHRITGTAIELPSAL